jgi:hypothetical protein
MLCLAVMAAAATSSAANLPVMLNIDWKRLPDIPTQGPSHQGFQDSDGAWIDDDTVVTAFGYSAGGVPGFLNTAWSINVSAVGAEFEGDEPALRKTGCSYEFPGNKCPASEPAVSCKTDTDCLLPVCPGGCTCHGIVATCHSGVCSSGIDATLCSSPQPAPSPSSWSELPNAPVSGRQEVGATLLDDGGIVYVGGFSYSAPYSFADVLRLDRDDNSGAWSWSVLPSLPYPVSSMGVVSIGNKVYVLGGADYNSKKFCVFTDCEGNNHGFGRHLLVLDMTNLAAGWTRGPDMPGSPRWVFSLTAVGGSMYVIGGATTNASVVDNWQFDPARAHWTQLPDLPISSGNFQTNGNNAFMDRYIILVGGYQYGHVYLANGTYGNPYGQAQRMCPDKAIAANTSGCHSTCSSATSGIVDKGYMGNWASEYDNDVFVFDTVALKFGRVSATSTQEPELMPAGCGGFPMNDNLPQINVRGARIFAVGGECDDRAVKGDYYGHYPRLAVVGEITKNE